MYGNLNLASLLLGLAAPALPLGLLGTGKRRPALRLVLSGLACGAALLCQLLYVRHLAEIQDWPALLDTIDSTIAASALLLGLTALLDLLAALSCQDGRS